jgi:hypothetical protein
MGKEILEETTRILVRDDIVSIDMYDTAGGRRESSVDPNEPVKKFPSGSLYLFVRQLTTDQ